MTDDMRWMYTKIVERKFLGELLVMMMGFLEAPITLEDAYTNDFLPETVGA